jgi:hypothetical protein
VSNNPTDYFPWKTQQISPAEAQEGAKVQAAGEAAWNGDTKPLVAELQKIYSSRPSVEYLAAVNQELCTLAGSTLSQVMLTQNDNKLEAQVSNNFNYVIKGEQSYSQRRAISVDNAGHTDVLNGSVSSALDKAPHY